FFQAEDGIRDFHVTGVQTCALPISTSMIGMIALAGIIVRNSILLVDFINHLIAHGDTLEQAVVDACAVRAQPIALTALAAMAGEIGRASCRGGVENSVSGRRWTRRT